MVVSRRESGFTLIEVMIVVVIIGILSTVAVVAYRKWIQTTYLAEAQDMVSNIRSAEEAFRAENGATYLPVLPIASPLGPGYDYPAKTPGSFKSAWGSPCTWCIKNNAWQQLAVQPNGPVAYGYSLVANDPIADPTGSIATPPSITVNGASMDLSAMKGQPWYVIEADGDYFGTGSFTKIFAFTGNNRLFISNGTQ